MNNVNIMLRILQEGDLRCKTENATTFLHESVKFALPPVFVARLFSLDCPLEERDGEGLTARQMAVRSANQQLVQVSSALLFNTVYDVTKSPKLGNFVVFLVS